MKKIVKYTLIMLLAAGIGITSCTGKFEEYNTNGETPGYGEIDPSTLLEQLISTGAYYINERSWRVNSELMQYTVDCSSATRIQRYVFQVAEYKTPWDRYQRYAANANHMIALAQKYEDANAEAIAMTLKAIFVSLVADLYGDIPYKEAYRIDENITQPQIDPQAEVYAALIDMLLAANDLYKVSTNSSGDYTYPLTVPGKDLLYGGDIAAWRRLTNSLCLRLCLRLSNRPEAGTAAVMQQIVSDPGKYPLMSSTGDDAKVSYTGVAPFKNNFGDMTDATFTTVSRKCSAFFIDQLHTTSDPRMAQWVRVSSSEDVHGVVSGVSQPDGSGACVMNVTVLKQYTTPVWFMTSSEVYFILSEAAHNGMITGGEEAAERYYEQAITNSIRQWNPAISDANIDRFLHAVGSKVGYNGTLEQIILQKWVSLFLQGFESWCDYRRTGYPQLPIGPDCDNEGVMPTRLCYPQTLVSTNSTNYQKQVAAMRAAYPVVGKGTVGGDNMLTPVWWSKRAIEFETGRAN
ncbi:SusD/RagB family nutrient-binding outer membrane lipoprotein [uncultured Alistipes sp.]|jgi:hypothetical protein|uniref:SusD/RagB family nutrient-binding outer membrane lipoprotein n=1 Tax=uncultured Alistipes sp. TaxID=538949 RepID=UPI0025D9A546|nr:SusD/RagB family nutrient-binding outer membrane lipoprotein [uncultured Alistipes sp.]